MMNALCAFPPPSFRLIDPNLWSICLPPVGEQSSSKRDLRFAIKTQNKRMDGEDNRGMWKKQSRLSTRDRKWMKHIPRIENNGKWRVKGGIYKFRRDFVEYVEGDWNFSVCWYKWNWLMRDTNSGIINNLTQRLFHKLIFHNSADKTISFVFAWCGFDSH